MGMSESVRTSISSIPAKSGSSDKTVKSENPYEVIQDSIVSIPKAMSEIDTIEAPPTLTPKQLPNPQESLVESEDSLDNLPPPPIPPKTLSVGDLSSKTSSSSNSSTGDYSIPERSSTLNPNVFLDNELTSTPNKQ